MVLVLVLVLGMVTMMIMTKSHALLCGSDDR